MSFWVFYMYFIWFLGFCPLGWVSNNWDCYYYHGGALKYDDAYKMCQVWVRFSAYYYVGKEVMFSVCLFVCLYVARISQKVLERFSCKFVERLAIDQGPIFFFYWIWLKIGWEFNKKSVCKLVRVAEMNDKTLDCVNYQYVMQIFNIHKQAELTKNNGFHSSVVYRIEWSLNKGHAIIYFSIT